MYLVTCVQLSVELTCQPDSCSELVNRSRIDVKFTRLSLILEQFDFCLMYGNHSKKNLFAFEIVRKLQVCDEAVRIW